jgi:putative membrane protein
MLTDADRKRIEQAVRQAETRTSGEIYCVVSSESSDYREVPLAWAGAAALVAPAILLAGGVHVTAPELMGDGWTAAQMAAAAEQAARGALGGAILLQGALFIAVALFTAVPPIRRFVTPRMLKQDRVRRRARELFMSKNLAATRAHRRADLYLRRRAHGRTGGR